jgi:hypothetical protein
MTEETRNAAVASAVGITIAIGTSAVLRWFLILELLFSIHYDSTVNSATGQPATRMFLDAAGEWRAIVLMIIIIGAMPMCG